MKPILCDSMASHTSGQLNMGKKLDFLNTIWYTFHRFLVEKEREAQSPPPAHNGEMLFQPSLSFLPASVIYIWGPAPEDNFVEYPVQLRPGLIAWHKVNNDNSDA